MNNRKAPRIRFKGYTDDWEQRKLGEIASSFEYGLNAAAKEFDGKNKYIRITDIYDDSREFDQNNVTSPDIDLLNADSYKLTKGDILFARTGASVGKTYIYKDFDGLVYYAGFLIRAKIKDSYIPEFIFQSTLTKAYEKFIKVTSMRSGQPGVNAQEYSQFELMIPEKPEQDKIGIYFTSLDQLITLHQRKLEKLKIVKKAMLENCFPKNGEKVPKFRFSGFSGDWEQRKVTELGKIYIGLVTTMTKHYTKEGTLLIRNSDIKDCRFEFGDNPIFLENTFAQENESRMHNIGDVITVHTGDVGTSAVITENEAKSIGFATIVTRPNIQIITSNYLCTFLNTDKHKRWAIAISTGDGRTNYNLGDYYELVIPVPSIREQQLISSFIQNLNHLITLHQRKLEKLKIIKKSFLEKMFV